MIIFTFRKLENLCRGGVADGLKEIKCYKYQNHQISKQ